MSQWQETCVKQRERLERVEFLADKLSDLYHKTKKDLPAGFINKLQQERIQLDRQLERLKHRRFEVAVIGLEKAGKSALLNAWLGQEILPSEDERCTYTTTEIWSAPNEDEQSLSIEYFTISEIDSLLRDKKVALDDLGSGSMDFKTLAMDIKETEDHLSEIKGYASKGDSSISFKDIAEVETQIYEAVAGKGSGKEKNRAHPRAIKRIRLKTTRLHDGEYDIVFHDVPGFNSTVSKHKEEARQKMAECDAIIFAKAMNNFNLDGSESDILNIAGVEDPHVTLGEKIFIALTKSDYAANKGQVEKWRKDNEAVWPTVPVQRITPVCSIAHLAKLGTGCIETNEIGNISAKKLENELGIEDGIELLKGSVDDYINTDRIKVVQKRCDTLVKEFSGLAKEAFQVLDPIYQDVEMDDIDEDNLLDEKISAWWGPEWISIKEEFQNWFNEAIACRENVDGASGEHNSLTELRNAYNDEIDILFTDLVMLKRESMESIYVSEIKGVTVPAHGNKAIRDKLYPEIKEKLLQKLPIRLTEYLQSMTDEMIQKSKSSLHNISGVEKELLKDPIQTKEQIQHGFETLFLRFGRIAVEAFIALPLKERPRILKEKKADILTLQAFYQNPKETKHGELVSYLESGLWMVKVASDLGVIPPIVGKGVEKIKVNKTSFDDLLGQSSENETDASGYQKKEPNNFNEVASEIEKDLDALKDYLKNSVFHAAGFITYSNQELERIRDRFIEKEEPNRRWDTLVRREIKRGNLQIKGFNAGLQDVRMLKEIALVINEAKRELVNIAG